MATEKKVENNIKGYLREKGAYVVKHHGSIYSQVGVPDLLVCFKGRFYGIEVKAPGESPSPLQLENIKRIKDSGGIAFVTDNLEEVKAVFDNK